MRKKAKNQDKGIEINIDVEKFREIAEQQEREMADAILDMDPSEMEAFAGGGEDAKEFVRYMRESATRIKAGTTLFEILNEKKEDT